MAGPIIRNVRRDMSQVPATALAAALHVALVSCERAAPADAICAGAVADSAAFARLPPTLARELDVRSVLTAAALRDTTRIVCESLRATDTVDVRRRLRAVLPDSARTVLFVRARRGDGALQRV